MFAKVDKTLPGDCVNDEVHGLPSLLRVDVDVEVLVGVNSTEAREAGGPDGAGNLTL